MRRIHTTILSFGFFLTIFLWLDAGWTHAEPILIAGNTPEPGQPIVQNGLLLVDANGDMNSALHPQFPLQVKLISNHERHAAAVNQRHGPFHFDIAAEIEIPLDEQ